MRRLWILGLGAVLLLSGCSAAPDQNSAVKQEKRPVYFLAGRIQAGSTADLSVPFAGRVQALLVDVGQTVTAGSPLIQFEASDLQASADAAKGSYEVAVANLNKSQSSARPELIRQTQATLDSSKIALDSAKKTLDRQQALKDAGATSESDFEAANTKYTTALGQYQSYVEQLNALKNGESKQTIEVMQQQVKQAKAAWDAATVTANNRVLVAPFDGVITAKNFKVGESAAAQTALLSIDSKDRMTVEAYGPATAVHNFKTGDHVLVRVAEVPDKTFSGTVVFVNDTIDTKRRATMVKVSLEPAPELMTGMFAEIGEKR